MKTSILIILLGVIALGYASALSEHCSGTALAQQSPSHPRHPLRFGIQTPQQNLSWEELRALWQEAERLGFDSAWVFDHFMPVFGDKSGPTLEGWTLLAALAGETSRLRIGCLVTGNTYRHPAVLAKMATTVDYLSGGRLELGLGAAWYAEEHRAYGLPFYTAQERAERLAEAVAVIRLLWTADQANFTGQYYQLQNAPFAPKPLQHPHPPIVIGGDGRKWILPTVARYADGWNCPFGHSPATAAELNKVIDGYCQQLGRDPGEIERSIFLPLALSTSRVRGWMTLLGFAAYLRTWPWRASQRLLVGTPPQVTEQIRQYREAGITHFIFLIPPTFNPQATLRLFAAEVMPAFRPQ
jgi:F420-dependent oxidoreductase-like protein